MATAMARADAGKGRQGYKGKGAGAAVRAVRCYLSKGVRLSSIVGLGHPLNHNKLD